MKRLEIANLVLLALLPVAWAAPLARAAILPFFSKSEISILSGLRDLFETDRVLALLVAFFAVMTPLAKTLTLAVSLRGWLPARPALGAVDVLGKLSMTEVFLVAVYIVAIKGVGIGAVETGWGLYLYTSIVLGGMAVAHHARRALMSRA
jgi:uncharacterized paraquat-inducible protein A